MNAPSPRARGRPAGGSAIDRNDIIGAALVAIARGGYDALSMRGVAREIGASLATVQRHFPTKDDLWRSAVDTFLDGFEAPQLWPSRHDSMLVTAIEQMLGRSSAHPGLIASLISDRSIGHEQRWAYLQARLAGLQESALANVNALQAEGLMRKVDPGALLMLMQIGVSSLANTPPSTRTVFGFNVEDEADRQRLAEALADILGFGLAVERPSKASAKHLPE